ncbi:MAG: ribose 5-phosphate isomerase B [Clostridiales bacterium]|mgnify:FL=1|nr:ribose 5-phosphate isomerase B [Clostridiales bacterium]
MIALGNDHTGLEMKRWVIEVLDELGLAYEDLGTNEAASCDYPVAGERVARAVAQGRCELGIAICGTGIGIGLAANKVQGIRCAMVSEPYSAMMARRHNDANMISIGARVLGEETAKMIVRTFLTGSFEGGRHQRRVDQIGDIERREHGQ